MNAGRGFNRHGKRDITEPLSRRIPYVALAAVLVPSLVLGVVPGAGVAPAWAARPWIARTPPVAPPAAHQLRDLDRWPAEPAEPKEIDPVRFRLSVEHLCERPKYSVARPAKAASKGRVDKAGKSRKSRRGRRDGKTGTRAAGEVLAETDGTSSGADSSGDTSAAGATVAKPVEPPLGDLVQAAAAEAGIDPFLLAGLMYEESGCRPGLESPRGYGLLRIHPGLYQSPGAPTPPGEKDDWRMASLLDPAENLRLGAKLLQMWSETHSQLDATFGGVPHRGAVSHFVWGDTVRGSGVEDQVMTARRRLIQFYLQTPEPTTPTSFGIVMQSPLEGTPRLASSGPGEDRAGGKRRHRGIDLSAEIGEPVRAVADGTVIFAGVNLPSAPRRAIPPSQVARYRWKRLGAGGIYVCIEHAPNRGVVSCYMHLDIYTISEGEQVKAGQMIGRVGRTGVQVSPPHLHFEIRVDDRFVDPARHLAALVIPPKATQTYRMVMQAKRMRVANARRAKAEAAAAAAVPNGG
jgi:murein DD-endopeptidase MepM/ murein hydrolase activator NlpD